ncbi:uncharacterized protein LOC142182227 [Nicotiana tabacum]|uniref:Uncharacterized protein LOC142182227 n=1 Tax=Nicotiana tabacum TaxID=4097 RepID=A0AC58USH9_TOBAC
MDFKHVPRVQNEFADALETFSSMIQHPDENYIDTIKVNVQDQPTYCFHVDEETDREPWYYDIKRRTPDLRLLRCVNAREATKLIEEIHAGTCGPNMNGFTLAKKILRASYFWMSMETYCIRFVQKCHQCQIHGDLI